MNEWTTQVRALGRNAAEALVTRNLIHGDCLFVVPIVASTILASEDWSFGVDVLGEEGEQTHITVGWAAHDTTFDVNHGAFLLPQWVAAETGGSATVVPSAAVQLKPGDFIECRAARSLGEFTFHVNGALVLAVHHDALSSLQVPLWPVVDARGGTFRFRFNESALLGNLAASSESGQRPARGAVVNMQSQSDFLQNSRPASDFSSFDSGGRGDVLDSLRAQQMLHDAAGPLSPDLHLDMSVNVQARLELCEASTPAGE